MINKTLDKEERAILDSFEKGEWKSVKNLKSEIKKAAKIASYTFKKDKRINIRVSERDLSGIQKKALKEGLPYQTLISSLIHKFVDGRLVERKS